MISLRLRVAAAIASAVTFALACYVLMHARRPIAAVLFAPAAVLALPMFASRRPPQESEWQALDDNVARFRTAGLVCFTAAVLAHALALSVPLGVRMTEHIAAFGVAWWAVGFGLIPFALYYASRRAMLEDDSID